MKVLHLASFIGNIGDNASHMGFYSLLDKYLEKVEIEQLEMRRFYQNYTQPDKLCFDQAFVDYANTFDRLIIGGGGFLDYWVPNSHTGTTLDIPLNCLEKIQIKTLITSMGCIPHKPIPEGNLDKFRAFLDLVIEHPDIHLSLRNDGSKAVLQQDVGEKYAEAIPEYLDNGFFYTPLDTASLPINSPYAAINITSDQLLMLSKYRGALNQKSYYAQLAKILQFLIQEESLHIVLVPHIYRDLEAISELLDRLPDFHIRNHISVAPCVQGNQGADYIFSLYKNSHFVFASRLHANICCLTMNKPMIGLAVLDRVKYIYDSLQLSNYVQPGDQMFEDFLTTYKQVKASTHGSRSAILRETHIYADTLHYYSHMLS